MSNTGNGGAVTTSFIVVTEDGQGAVVLQVSLALSDVSPQALSDLMLEVAGVDAVLLHDGGLVLGEPVAPILMEALSDLPSKLEVAHVWHWPPNARPWQRPGWFKQATAWLTDALDSRGEALTGEVRQISSYDLASVLHAKTSGGGVYFKAGSETREATITAHLAKRHLDLTPEVIAWDGKRDWLATRDGGRRLSESADFTLWEDAFAKLAHFQRTADANALTALGCPTHPFSDLADRAEVFLRDATTLHNWGLHEKQITSLADLVPFVQRAHTRVKRLDLGELPAHGDAQPMNALTGPTGCVWFDWSEASISHPFMDVGWCLTWLSHPSRAELAIRRAYPDAVSRLWSAYLGALGVKHAEPLLSEAMILAMTQRTLVYHGRFHVWQGTVPGWRPHYVPYYLRLLLKMPLAG
jgi:hypothetical protein